MMMALGLFVFSVSTVAYQQLQRSTSWRHATQSRVGERPASQFLGEGEDTLSLSGTLVPEFTGGRFYMSFLRRMAGSGQAFPMVEGTGTLYGFWVIESIEETSSVFMRDGKEQQIDFTLKLRQVDEPSGELSFFYDSDSDYAPPRAQADGPQISVEAHAESKAAASVKPHPQRHASSG